ncbi:MAG: hydrolase, partial [Bacteroidota bacterium]
GAANYGGFYNGNLLNVNVETSYRIQPWANFGVVYDYNNIRLGEGFGDKELHLLRFTGNFTFTKNLLFNNVLQYNTQGENFSIFSRFQWRYAPMSDLFVIFNQNQNTNGLGIQNRGFIVKLTYWL